MTAVLIALNEAIDELEAIDSNRHGEVSAGVIDRLKVEAEKYAVKITPVITSVILK